MGPSVSASLAMSWYHLPFLLVCWVTTQELEAPRTQPRLADVLGEEPQNITASPAVSSTSPPSSTLNTGEPAVSGSADAAPTRAGVEAPVEGSASESRVSGDGSRDEAPRRKTTSPVKLVRELRSLLPADGVDNPPDGSATAGEADTEDAPAPATKRGHRKREARDRSV